MCYRCKFALAECLVRATALACFGRWPIMVKRGESNRIMESNRIASQRIVVSHCECEVRPSSLPKSFVLFTGIGDSFPQLSDCGMLVLCTHYQRDHQAVHYVCVCVCVCEWRKTGAKSVAASIYNSISTAATETAATDAEKCVQLEACGDCATTSTTTIEWRLPVGHNCDQQTIYKAIKCQA